MRKGLLISTMLVSVAGLGMSAEAANQCLQTPSCESLGYTQTSCVDNNGVKCPFGNKYFCVCPAKYAYSCSGTGYTGGKGTACGGKYTECTCASGYVWENGGCATPSSGKCSGIAKTCKIGDILFSDRTCSTDRVAGKTPIAVVVYISPEGCGQALALRSLDKPYGWTIYDNISSITFDNAELASHDFNSCSNTEKMMAYTDIGNRDSSLAWTVHKYSTTGTKAGEWCLPAAGIFTNIYNNFGAVCDGLNKSGGTQLSTSTYAWSSTAKDISKVWNSHFKNNYGLSYSGRSQYTTHEVRPVIEF